MTGNAPGRFSLIRLAAMLGGCALVLVILSATGVLGDLVPTGRLAGLLSPPSCLDFEVSAEVTIPDAMRYNWRSSQLDWLQIAATNRCPEDVSFDVTFNVERAFPGGRESDSIGVPCTGPPCEFPQTIRAPPCTLRPEPPDLECAAGGVVLEQLDPRLDLANWTQEDALFLEFNVHVVENRPRERGGGLFGLLFNDEDRRGDEFPRAVELLPGTTYLWEWNLINNPRQEGNPREAALASLAVWAITRVRDRRAFAEQWPVDDSRRDGAGGAEPLDNWMRRIYDELLSGFDVRTGEDQLPPNFGDVVIDSPETVLETRRGSPIEIAMLVATLASSAIRIEGRNDHILVLMAPRPGQSRTNVFVAWVNADVPDDLQLLSPAAVFPAQVGSQEFFQAVEETRRELELDGLAFRRILDAVNCNQCDGVYVDADDPRIAVVNVMRAAAYYDLAAGLPMRDVGDAGVGGTSRGR